MKWWNELKNSSFEELVMHVLGICLIGLAVGMGVILVIMTGKLVLGMDTGRSTVDKNKRYNECLEIVLHNKLDISDAEMMCKELKELP